MQCWGRGFKSSHPVHFFLRGNYGVGGDDELISFEASVELHGGSGEVKSQGSEKMIRWLAKKVQIHFRVVLEQIS